MNQRGASSPGVFLFKGFRFDRGRGELSRMDNAGTGTPVAIGSRASALLGLLVEHQNRLVHKAEIIETVWQGAIVEAANLTVQIATLRRILDSGGTGDSFIQTVARRGYRFIAPVTRLEPQGSSVLPSIQGGCANVRPGAAPTRLTGPCIRSEPPGRLISLPNAMPRLSIVVLPFSGLSHNREQQYFADGITDDLTTDLSRIPDMFVISRNTALTYRGRSTDTKQIGRELGVRYILDGSVRRSGEQIRVTTELIDAETDGHLWAERFDGDRSDTFALQDEITGRVAVAVSAELVKADATRQADHPDATDYIFRGRAALSKLPARENYAEAIAHFERALTLEPGSAVAQSWLATALADRVIVNMTGSAASDLARAGKLIKRALAASPSLQQAHFARGQILRWRGRPEEASSEYEAMIALNRNSVNALAALTWCDLYTGAVEQIPPTLEHIFRLSPRDPNIGHWHDRIGLMHLLQSRIEEAIVWLEKAQNVSPRSPNIHAHLASAYALEGETDRAAAEIARTRELAPDDRYSSIRRLKAVIGYLGVPKVRWWFETTYLAGLRKAGVPEG